MRTDRMRVKITSNTGDFETEFTLPCKYEICPKCEGCGSHLNPSIGEHAYTAEEFYEEFSEEDRAEYFKRGGIYDVQCFKCHGERVIQVPDVRRMTAQEKKVYNVWVKQERRREALERQWKHERDMGY